MIGLTLKQLRYFEALAQHLHFGRAADACAISQPALSLQIKELEALIGAALIERSARQIRLTPIGEDLLVKAREILFSVDELEDLVRAAKGPLAGRLRLGVIPTIAPYLLPKVVAALSDRFPGLDLKLREAMTHVLLQDLHEGRIDLAIMALPLSEPTLTEFALFEEEFVLVRPTQDQDLPVPSADRLKTMRLLLLEEGHCFRDQALAFCDFGSAKPGALVEGSSLSTLVQMVGAGMGITLIPDMAVAMETRSADVAVARFPAPAPARTIGMAWRRSNPLSSQLMEVGAIIRNVGRGDPAET